MIRERRPVSLGKKGLAGLREFATHGNGKGYARVDTRAANTKKIQYYLSTNKHLMVTRRPTARLV